MTPAIAAARNARIEFRLHRYDPSAGAREVAAALGIDPVRMLKTLVAVVDGDGAVVALVPAPSRLDLAALARACGAATAALAPAADAERVTGYAVGGISPLGQRRPLPTVVDVTATRFPTVYVGAGQAGLELELRPDDLLRLCEATSAAIAR
jgi:Cys-tRNA(Pro)/Cys-tRNA(Cys) deacylase